MPSNEDMERISEELRAHLRAQLEAYGKAYHDAMEEWALRCLRPIDPREWRACKMQSNLHSMANLRLLDPKGTILGTFNVVVKDGQTFFRGLVFGPVTGKPSDTTEPQ